WLQPPFRRPFERGPWRSEFTYPVQLDRVYNLVSRFERDSKKGTIVDDNSINRRQFVQHAAQVGAALGVAGRAFGARPGWPAAGRVIGANDRINIGAIGVGGRGSYLAREFADIGERNNGCQIVAVCDVYRKR